MSSAVGISPGGGSVSVRSSRLRRATSERVMSMNDSPSDGDEPSLDDRLGSSVLPRSERANELPLVRRPRPSRNPHRDGRGRSGPVGRAPVARRRRRSLRDVRRRGQEGSYAPTIRESVRLLLLVRRSSPAGCTARRRRRRSPSSREQVLRFSEWPWVGWAPSPS